MASASSSPVIPPFIRLPPSIRQRIYTYLLAPHSEEDVTFINYTLHWPWLDNPSNTTFAGDCQIDRCHCPQDQQHPHASNAKSLDHIYTRYACYGPEVQFKSAKEDLWVPTGGYAHSGKINFLQPGRRCCLGNEPSLDLLTTCKTVYQEAVGTLYRNRNFLFLTGPCPRGRYQAYATQHFLSRLTPLARSHVSALSIIALPHEEDADLKEVWEAYMNLAVYIQLCLPSFKTLYLDVGDVRMTDAVDAFQCVLEKEGVEICLGVGVGNIGVDREMFRCTDAEEFKEELQQVCGRESPVNAASARNVRETPGSINSSNSDHIEGSKAARSKPRHPSRKPASKRTPTQAAPKWEEVQANVSREPVVLQQLEHRSACMVLRKVSKVQQVLSKWGKGKERAGAGGRDDDAGLGDDEWVVASLSPVAEAWEVL
jgi:hypothetical protein